MRLKCGTTLSNQVVQLKLYYRGLC